MGVVRIVSVIPILLSLRILLIADFIAVRPTTGYHTIAPNLTLDQRTAVLNKRRSRAVIPDVLPYTGLLDDLTLNLTFPCI